MKIGILICIVAIGALSVGASANFTVPAQVREVKVIKRIDSSEFNMIVKRPIGINNLPVVLMIDGAGCYSTETIEKRAWFTLPAHLNSRAAVLIVEKPGVELAQAQPDTCSQEYMQRYTIDQRVLDHLRALQHLRRYAEWWNGEVLINGYSDGGTVGVMLASYYPHVTRAALGGFGGGITRANLLAEFSACQDQSIDKASSAYNTCEQALVEQLMAIRANPVGAKTWRGGDNSFAAWASKLDVLEMNMLKNIGIPLLFYHGQEDTDVPVVSARVTAEELAPYGVPFTYWEIPLMGHNPYELPDARHYAIQTAIYNWLFSLPTGPGGPPTYGVKSYPYKQ